VTETEDLRTFIREITLMFERGMERISREIREDSRKYFERIDAERRARHEENREKLEQQREKLEQQREKLDEILAEGRAGRQALFRMLDKLDGGGTAPAG
jgi:predicted ribosome quality control (RQC) complex YloA/Tae2 family protein